MTLEQCNLNPTELDPDKESAPLDVERVTHSFAQCLAQNGCSSQQLIGAANILLDQAIEQIRNT